jgi:hypothetical protein
MELKVFKKNFVKVSVGILLLYVCLPGKKSATCNFLNTINSPARANMTKNLVNQSYCGKIFRCYFSSKKSTNQQITCISIIYEKIYSK